jgi:beta-phosphoglucomutase-like phosphatase (HAD superfamily)
LADVRFLLWDFGDTLADERWLWPCPDGVPEWADQYRALCSGAFGRRWNCGTATVDDLVAELSARVGMPVAAVLAHVRKCCGEVHFFEQAWAAARSHALPQAIVTVNPDVFRDLVVVNYSLAEFFDAIVISAEEATENKADLCAIAAARLGCDDPAQALLIDNLEEHVDSWRSRGGAAYWFRGDERFAADLAAGGWNGLASSS